MNIAAIDIGSNGARLLIKSFDDNAPAASRIKKLLFVRIPLRLGKDVFALGKISKERQRMMMHMMKGFRQFMLLYNVEHFRACATSAMRDAENGKKVMRHIEKETGIKLEIIPGAEEAQLLCNNLVENTESGVGNFAYVDVGGGSTEISLLHDGVLAESPRSISERCVCLLVLLHLRKEMLCAECWRSMPRIFRVLRLLVRVVTSTVCSALPR